MLKRYSVVVLIAFTILIIVPQLSTAQANVPEITWTRVSKERSQRIVDISPDGKRILFGDIQTQMLSIFDWQTEQIIWQTPMDISAAITSRWSPDGRHIATLVGGSIYVFNTAQGLHVSEIETSLNKYESFLRLLTTSEHIGYTDFKWSSDSNQLSVMAYGYVLIYDLPSDSVTTIVDLVMVASGDLREYLHWFDWSPDGSKFAAFHYKITNDQAVFPIEIVMGLWDENGRWLSQYEEPNAQNSEQDCIPNGQDEWKGGGVPPGGEVAWSPDNKTLLVSTNFNGYRLCILGNDGTLRGHHILGNGDNVNRFFWSFDQKWLIGIATDCSLLIFNTVDDYSNYRDQFSSGRCVYDSASWSHDGRYLAIGSELDLWMGTLVSQPT